jgi:hypothetical protein
LISVYKRIKKGPGTTYFGEKGFGREIIRFFYKTFRQNHHGFAISSFGLLIKGHLFLSRKRWKGRERINHRVKEERKHIEIKRKNLIVD